MSTVGPCPNCGDPLSNELKGICPRCLARDLQGDRSSADADYDSVNEGAKARSPGVTAASSKVPAEAKSGVPFGKYLNIKKIGAGGMGEVWKAWDTTLERWVALKFLKSVESDLPRFRREGRTPEHHGTPNACPHSSAARAL